MSFSQNLVISHFPIVFMNGRILLVLEIARVDCFDSCAGVHSLTGEFFSLFCFVFNLF